MDFKLLGKILYSNEWILASTTTQEHQDLHGNPFSLKKKSRDKL